MASADAPKGCPPGPQSAPLVADLEAYMREQCAKLSRGHDHKAMNYMFKRWGSFTRFLDDGRVCLSNNAAEKRRCAASHWAESRGYSADPTAEGVAPPPCIASSSPPR